MRKYRSLLTSLLVLLLLNLLVVFSGFSSSEHCRFSLAEEVVGVLDGVAEEIVEEEDAVFSGSIFLERYVLVVPSPIYGHSLGRHSLAGPASLALGWIVPLLI